MKCIISSFMLCALLAACSTTSKDNMFHIRQQGSFLVGGSVVTAPGTYDEENPTVPDGQTLHGDHAYVFYQIPDKAHRLPLVFLHGNGESAKTWETTPDGRDGFQNIFLQRRFSVYLVDQPRRGKAGKSTVPDTIQALPDEAFQFEIFRVGVFPNPFPGVQFPKEPQAWEQFMRQVTPNTGVFDKNVVSDAISALFTKIGDGILVTHSMGGGPGWLSAIKNPHVCAIIAYEPGSGFVFPADELPAPIPHCGPEKVLVADPVSKEEFMKLTRIPIVIYYGDNIPEQPSEHWGQDTWRARLEMAHLFTDCINRHGGDAQVVHLPDLGIKDCIGGGNCFHPVPQNYSCTGGQDGRRYGIKGLF